MLDDEQQRLGSSGTGGGGGGGGGRSSQQQSGRTDNDTYPGLAADESNIQYDQYDSSPPAYSSAQQSSRDMAGGLNRQFTDRAVSGGGSIGLSSAAVARNPEQQFQRERLRMAANFDPRLFVARLLYWGALLAGSVVVLALRYNAECDRSSNLRLWLVINSLVILATIGGISMNFYNYRMRRRVNQTQTFLNSFGFIWWIIGQVWVFRASPETCDPAIWGTALALVCLEYLRNCLPCIFLMLFICCMPCIAPFLDQVSMEGANKKEINKLPTTKYKVDPENPDDQCVVCLEDFKEGEEIRTLPCDHYFHSKCIDQWLQLNRTCPLCRKDIGDKLAAETGAGQGAQQSQNQQQLPV